MNGTDPAGTCLESRISSACDAIYGSGAVSTIIAGGDDGGGGAPKRIPGQPVPRTHNGGPPLEDSVSLSEVGRVIGIAEALGPAALVLPLYGDTPKPSPPSSETFFDGAKYSPKVKNQMRFDKRHGFPTIIDGLARQHGVVDMIKGADGQYYSRLRLEGQIKAGRNGYYEWIKGRDGIINHRFFVEVVR